MIHPRRIRAAQVSDGDEPQRLANVWGGACKAKDCGGLCAGGKPYCHRHVELMPYVRRLRRRDSGAA